MYISGYINVKNHPTLRWTYVNKCIGSIPFMTVHHHLEWMNLSIGSWQVNMGAGKWDWGQVLTPNWWQYVFPQGPVEDGSLDISLDSYMPRMSHKTLVGYVPLLFGYLNNFLSRQADIKNTTGFILIGFHQEKLE